MLGYTVVVWNEKGDDWMSVESLLSTQISPDVVAIRIEKLQLAEAEIIKQHLENRHPDRYFLIHESLATGNKLSGVG